MKIIPLIFLSLLLQVAMADNSPFILPSSPAIFSGDMANMPRLESMDVKCGRTGMNVELKFSAVFPGVVYSKGHFSDPACLYVREQDAKADVYRFTIPLDGCGTRAIEDEGTTTTTTTTRRRPSSSSSSSGRSLGNTLILQNDPLIQEVWDEARQITCTWRNNLEKSVAFLPLKVYEPETIDVLLDARSINTLMEIHTGQGGPLSSPPTGYVHMGDDISVVMYVQGPQMDANVVSCNATTAGRGATVQLVDDRGCLERPDLMTPFAKTTATNGVDADLMLYSYLKAFNIAESPEFIISCELELCENECPKPCPGGNQKARKKRSKEEEEEDTVSDSDSKRRVKLENRVTVLSKRERRERKRAECLFQSATALLSLALLMTLVSSLGVLSAALGHKLWALKAEMRRKNMY